MGYVFLLISLLAGAVKGFCGKKLSGFASNIQSAVLLNLIRMVLCIFFALLVVLLNQDLSYLTWNLKVLSVSALSGISTSFFVVSWIVSAKKSAYMMLDVFLMLGTIIPVIMGRVLFLEPISMQQGFGFIVLVIAALIMCSYNNSVRAKTTFRSMLLLIFCGIANGITDFSQKLYVKTFPELPVTIFNLYTYVFATTTLLICYFLGGKKEKVAFVGSLAKKSIYIIFVMAIALTIHSQCKTMAATFLDSAKLYPFNQGVTLVLSTLMSVFFFHEKFTRKAFAGLLLAFIGLMIMNL